MKLPSNLKLNRRQKKTLRRIVISSLLLLVSAIFLHEGILPDAWYFALPVFLIPYVLIGWDVWRKAILNLGNGQLLDENFLMVIATVGALVIGEYPEAVFVMLFYQVGELFQNIAVSRSRQSIAALMNIRPDTACVLHDGNEVTVSPEEVQIGDCIVVRPGEKIPLDGVVEEGASALDTASLTGESLPREVTVGERVVSGCVNLTGVLRIRVEKPFGESTVSKILELVENSTLVKSKTEQTITRFARIYTPCVVGGALLLGLIPSLVTGNWMTWVYRAMIFLVVSCPCALVISVPLSYFSGLGAASRRGILIKGANYLEALSSVDTVVFDKTGTLTEGKFRVSEVLTFASFSKEEILALASSAEQYSNHPIALSLRDAAVGLPQAELSDIQELAGFGVTATSKNGKVLVGNEKLMREHHLSCPPIPEGQTAVYVALGDTLCGAVLICDHVKTGVPEALGEMKKVGVRRCVMLTGDRESVAKVVAEELGVDEFHAGLLPADKVSCMENILKEKKGNVCFVGDGVNDAPVLARADIGFAMGAMGSDAAIEAADVVLMDDRAVGIAESVKVARKTSRIVWQNICFALGVKVLLLVLSVFGLTNMWVATFGDVGVAVLAILNAMRAGGKN